METAVLMQESNILQAAIEPKRQEKRESEMKLCS